MFHKPNSSTHSRGKRSKEIPLRKSDRRQLRQLAGELLLGNNNNNNNNETTAASENALVLDHIFLQGSLVSKRLDLPENQLPYTHCTLYYRAPDDEADSSSCYWPYTQHSQCIWIQVEERLPPNYSSKTTPSQKYKTHNLPGLALLSVIDEAAPSDVESNRIGHVVLNSFRVSEYLCRGAHLMRVGMTLQRPASASSSSVVGIHVPGNPQCMAVGLLLLPCTADLEQKGVGVFVISCYGDDLWKQQNSNPSLSDGVVSPIGGALYNQGHYGNVGFMDGKIVVPITNSDADEVEKEEEDFEKIAIGMTEMELQVEQDISNNNETGSLTPIDAPNDSQAVLETINTSASQEEDTVPMSADDVLIAAVYKGLLRLHPKRDLPMTVANFYAQHVLPNRPENTLIELKQTKWKKFGNYVKELVDEGLLTVGSNESKSDDMAMLLHFNKAHPSFRSFRESNKDVDDSECPKDNRLVLTELYIIPTQFVNMLQLDPEAVKATHASSPERKNTGMLTVKELKGILNDYIDREQLVDSSRPDLLNLDGPLMDVLYGKNGKVDKTTSLLRKDLALQWQEKMQVAYALVEMPGSRIVHLGRGKAPTVQIEVVKRQNKKFITHIRGMEDYGIHATSFCKEVTHRFACSGSVEEAPERRAVLKKDHVELTFQGNLADELEALLLGDPSLTSHGGAQNSPYRLPKGCIEVVLRKGVPARKKKSGSMSKK